MKKILVLIVLAAAVGAVIARARRQAAPEPVATAPNPAALEVRGVEPGGLSDPVETPAEPPRPDPAAGDAAGAAGEQASALLAPGAVPLVARAPDPRPAPEAHVAPAPAPDIRPASETHMPEALAASAQPPAAAAEEEPPLASIEALERAAELARANKRLEARKVLSALYVASGGRVRQAARRVLDEINKELVFNPACTEGALVHVIKHGETLTSIAPKYHVNWRGIKRLNRIVDERKIQPNQKLKILTGRRQVLVDKSEFLLALFIDGQFIKQYPIGHGKDNRTPTGDFVIETAEINPPWTRPDGKVIKHGEKGHLIGDRWLGFKDKPGAAGIGIHGTNDSKSIGTMCSNGCIRMHNEDVIELFDLLTRGAAVKIVD